MKIYRGERQEDSVLVTVDGRPLNPRLDLWNHSPTGFGWGYGGSGPAQLALALLSEHLNDDDRALELYQDFKRTVVVGLPHEGWTLTSEEVETGLLRSREDGDDNVRSSL